MRVGVDQTGQNGHIAQVLDRTAGRESPTATIVGPAMVTSAVGHRRARRGKDVAGTEGVRLRDTSWFHRRAAIPAA